MRVALLAVVMMVVLLSLGVSYLFDITFVALVTSLLVFVKQLKITFALEWLARFIFIRVPQRVLTALVKLYIIDRQTMLWLKELLQKYQQYWQKHHKTKLVVLGVFALVAMGVLAWQVGIWLLVIYEGEVLFGMVWRRIWPTLSETAFVQAVSRAFAFVAHTRIGRAVLRLDAWLEAHLRKGAEATGRKHKERAVRVVEETLTGLFMRLPPTPPVPKAAPGHWHLIGSHPRRAGKHDAKPRHGGYRPPSTRPKR